MLDTQDAINLNLHSIEDEVNRFTEYVITSGKLQEYLVNQEEKPPSEKVLVEKSIINLLFSYPYTYDFLLVNKAREKLSFVKEPDISLQELEQQKYMQQIQAMQGASYWIGPLENQELVGEDQVLFTIGRSILSPSTLGEIGYLFFHIKPEVLNQVNQVASRSDSEWHILDNNGMVIYSAGSTLIGEDLSAYASGEEGSDMFKRSDGEEYLLTHSPTFNNWTLVSSKSWKSVNAQIEPIRLVSIILAISLLLFFIFFHRRFTQRLLRFFAILKSRMVHAAEDNLQTKMPDFKEPEFQHLSKEFNDMVGKLQTMIELVEEEQKQKRQAEFKVLQHQLNPHFLYNTLESVNSLASLNKVEEVQQLVTNLGKLLRIILTAPDEITFAEEMRHVQSYLEIHKIRYGSRFEYKFQIDTDIEQLGVVKLILQPLIENCIEHSIRSSEFNLITIRASRQKNSLVIDVIDNGPGFSSQSLYDLFYKAPSNSKGHGVLNVYDRLRMYYEHRSGFVICSSDTGTIIRITIPITA
jgi:two-component system sensor histidine kinase YesM